MEAKEIVNTNENVLLTAKYSVKACAVSKLKACSLYIFMWVIMNAFFVYLTLLEKISYKYWFVSVPIICFDIIGILALYNFISKSINKIAEYTYVITDRAFYFYNGGKYKQLKRFSFQDITYFEKDKRDSHIFYVCSKNDYVEVAYIQNEVEFYSLLAKMINSK